MWIRTQTQKCLTGPKVQCQARLSSYLKLGDLMQVHVVGAECNS